MDIENISNSKRKGKQSAKKENLCKGKIGIFSKRLRNSGLKKLMKTNGLYKNIRESRSKSIRVYKKYKASMTLEASFIFPLVFLSILLLLYLSFYLHDMVKIKALINDGLIMGREYILQETLTELEDEEIDPEDIEEKYTIVQDKNNQIDLEVESYLMEYIRNQLEKGFFIFEKKYIKTEYKHQVLYVEIGGIIEIPLLESNIGERLFHIIEQSSIKVEDIPSFIRRMTGVFELKDRNKDNKKEDREVE